MQRVVEELGGEHKNSVWINHHDEIWAWVQGDWRQLRNSGIWSGLAMRSGHNMMRHRGPYTEVDGLTMSGSDYCSCSHLWSQHRVSAYGEECAVPCTGRQTYADDTKDECYCVRQIPLHDVHAAVQPFSDIMIQPRRR